MGRPKGSVNRSVVARRGCRVTIRFSEAERLVLEEEAQSRCMTLSAHIQDLIEVGRKSQN